MRPLGFQEHQVAVNQIDGYAVSNQWGHWQACQEKGLSAQPDRWSPPKCYREKFPGPRVPGNGIGRHSCISQSITIRVRRRKTLWVLTCQLQDPIWLLRHEASIRWLLPDTQPDQQESVMHPPRKQRRATLFWGPSVGSPARKTALLLQAPK